MPAVVLNGHISSGHGCFPPTPVIATQITTVKVNGIMPAVISDQYIPHSCNKSTHPFRPLTICSNRVFFENRPVARIGDQIGCGDRAGQGSINVFAG